MNDELEIDAIAPQKIFVNGKVMTEKDALDAVSSALEELGQTGNIEKLDKAESTLIGLQRISGKALAYLLHGKKDWWIQTGQEKIRQCTFEDYEFSTHGMKTAVIDRYITVWNHMQDFPEQFASRPIRDLIPVAKTLEQDYSIPEKIWHELIAATSNAEILSIVRKVKNSKPRKSSMQLKEERDGSVYLWKDGKRKFVCKLNTQEEDDKDIHSALERIRKGAGVIKK